MKLAFSTLACPTWSWERAIAAAQEYGYSGLEVRILDGQLLSTDLNQETRQRVRKTSAVAGIPILSVDTTVCIAQPEPAAREIQVRDGLAYLELAAEWESPTVRVFGYPPEGTSEMQAEQAAVACLQPLAKRGQELGVSIALETHDAFGSVASVSRILNQVGTAGAGMIWDIMNTYTYGEPLTESIHRLGSYLKHIHVKDGRRPASSGAEWECCLLGQGSVPIREALKRLHAAGYGGWLSVEWEKKWQPQLEEPEVALPQYAALLQNYLAELEIL
jgi:sugar phosphate isomerase/epimerase